MNRFLRSFYYAWNGIVISFREQPNLRIHFSCALIAIFAGWYFEITTTEWLAIILAIGFVIVSELVNTAIESMVDLVSPQRQPLAGKIKDIAAGAVLVASLTAVIVGCVIFKKYLF